MAKKINLVIDQGSDFLNSFDITLANGQSVDLSTFTGQSQMREHDSAISYYSIDVTVAAAEIILSLSAIQSANIEAGRYLYDVEITDGTIKYRILEGIVTVTPNITR